MAEWFDTEGSYEDVEFLGGGKTRDVLVTGVRTKPSGIYLEVRVALESFRKQGAGLVNAVALSWSQVFEDIARMAHVGGVQWSQESRNGQLQDVAIITVLSNNGGSEATLTVPVLQLGENLHAPQIAALNKQLNAVDAL